MLYKYIYYKIYEWSKERIDPTAPQITTTIILSLFPLSILYVLLRIFSYLNFYSFDMSFTISSTFIMFGVIFLILVVFNQIYFFAYNDWKEIILYFRNTDVSMKMKRYAKFYIIFCTSVYAVLFFFLGYKF